VVAHGSVYVPANAPDATGTSVLYARDARTGAARWSVPFPPDPFRRGQQTLSAPAVDNGLVYVGHIGISGIGMGTTYGGGVTGYNERTGGPGWSSTFFAGGVSGPTVANHLVYATARFTTFLIGSFSGLAAWDAGPSGQSEFVGSGGGPDRPASAPAIAAGVAYSGSEAGALVAVDAAGITNCTPTPPGVPPSYPSRVCAALWSTPTGGPISSTPAVSGGVVYVGSDDAKLYAVDAGGCGGAATCSPLWTATTGAAIESSPAVANGKVYVGSDDGRLYAFAAAGCGSPICPPLWTATTGAAVKSSPAEANGVVYVGSDDGRVDAFASAGCGAPTCAPIWSYATGGAVRSSPAVANGMVYVGSDDGRLYAFGLPR
jgi:outer membrane protein assembly factor BamB